MKAIFKESVADILPHVLERAEFLEVVDLEVIPPPRRMDRAYRILYNGEPHLLDIEFQASYKTKMPYRLLVYYGLLRLEDEKTPIICLVIYLFKSSLLQSPLREFNGDGEVVEFHFRVLALWTLDAREYVKGHVTCMYPFLPTMSNADAALLLQVIDEMVEYCKEDEEKLARHLLWFGVFLRRTDTVKDQDKLKVRKRLDVFEQLLEEDPWVREHRALWEEQAERQRLGRLLLEIVSKRFPALNNLAQQRVAQTSEPDALNEIIVLISTAPDEATVRHILSAQSAA
jgi:hypothetical protein